MVEDWDGCLGKEPFRQTLIGGSAAGKGLTRKARKQAQQKFKTSQTKIDAHHRNTLTLHISIQLYTETHNSTYAHLGPPDATCNTRLQLGLDYFHSTESWNNTSHRHHRQELAMSKRVADGQGGAERYGGMEDPRDTAMDPPRKATAAQLAKRR
jgi:hypothetical protein